MSSSAAPRRDRRHAGRTAAAPVDARDRDRHAHARHDRRAAADLDRLSYLHDRLHRRGPVHHAAQSLEPAGPDLLDRGDGDRHGADHRHAPHRSFRRFDPWLRLDDHRRHAGLFPAQISRPRQSLHLDHHGAHGARDRRRDRRVSGLARRLSRHSRLHRHARRPIVLARRGLVGDDGRDHRAAGRAFLADGRRSRTARSARPRAGRSGLLACARRHPRPLLRAGGGARNSTSRSGRCGRKSRSRSSAASSRSARPGSSTPIPGPSASRRSYAEEHNIAVPGGRPVHFHRLRDPGADRARSSAPR